MNRKMKVTFERKRGRERERCWWWRREGGFNRSLWHGGCEMRWWNRRIGGREAGRAGRGEGDCVSKCGCLEIGLPPCQMIKMFPLTFIFPLSGILPMYDEPCVNECGFTDVRIGKWSEQRLETPFRQGWLRHREKYFNIHTFQEFNFIFHSNRNVNLQ